MFKKFFVLCVFVTVDVFGLLETPEAKITYQISGETLVKAADIFQKGAKMDKTSDQNIDLGIFALCYKNYQNNFNQDYLESVFTSLTKLPQGVSSCVTLVIDDAEEEISAEITDLIRVCKQFNKWHIPVYISWNGRNLGIRQSRDNLLELIRLFGTKYILLADSDDILHPDCLPIMYQTMENNENLYLLLGEYSLLGYLNNRPADIEPYKNKQLSLDSFKIKPFFENSDYSNNIWSPIEDKPLVIKKTSSSPNKGNGYLPAMIKYFDQIPTECHKNDGSMLGWYGDITKILEDINPNSNSNWANVRKDPNMKGDPQYAILTPSDGASFLYFYRLYSQSHSHGVDRVADKVRVLNHFVCFIRMSAKESSSTENMLGLLIKEFCPLQNTINIGINAFDFNKLPDECACIKSVVENRIDSINKNVHSFWGMVQDLRNGAVDQAGNWIDEFLKKTEDIELFDSLRLMLIGYFQFFTGKNGDDV